MRDKKYTSKYLKEAKDLSNFTLSGTSTVIFESPSNIALIKYWGKYGDQLPQNPSVSFTLKNSKTITEIVYQPATSKGKRVKYIFDGKPNVEFEEKIIRYFEKISVFMPFLKKLDFRISSHNTFPHSAGIASSASSFSAIAICVCSIESKLFGTLSNPDKFLRKASFLARLGSGSACRSVYGKIVVWGKTEAIEGSSNELAISIDEKVHDKFKTYNDAILIIDSGKKEFSSTMGHGLMQKHPFAKARYKQASENLGKLLTAMQQGDEKTFAQVVENEALTLHGLMMSSSPSFTLLKPNSLKVISKLNEFRATEKIDLTYTLDAGPNIHILYPQKHRDKVKDFINNQLKDYCENGLWIDDQIWDGPVIR